MSNFVDPQNLDNVFYDRQYRVYAKKDEATRKQKKRGIPLTDDELRLIEESLLDPWDL